MNYYELLGVAHNATQYEIRLAFRKQAKELHPDTRLLLKTNHKESRLRAVIKAYRTLSNVELRKQYDAIHGIYRQKKAFNFREFLKQNPSDLKSQSRLLFYDLLHDYPDEAIALYEKYFIHISRKSKKSLSYFFPYEDYMDCIYLLAELYESSTQYKKAFNIYCEIAINESKRPCFLVFFIEVQNAIKRIVKYWEKHDRDALLRALAVLRVIKGLGKSAYYLKLIHKQYARKDTGHSNIPAFDLDSNFSTITI